MNRRWVSQSAVKRYTDIMATFLMLVLFGLAQANVVPVIMNDTEAFAEWKDDFPVMKEGKDKFIKKIVKNESKFDDLIEPVFPGDFMRRNPDWLFEGDIIPLGDSRKVGRFSTLWSNQLVPYKLDSTLSSAHRSAIAESIAHWEEHTCLTFNDETANTGLTSGFMYFTDDRSGCFSYVGRVNFQGGQPVNIGNGCQYPQVVIHEIGHALGFTHEQSRTGRDHYVRILFNNIQSGREGNFQERSTNNYDVEYDYLSIMHYRPQSFENRPYRVNTIQSVDPRYQYLMGTGQVLSFRDKKTANRAYCTDMYASDCGISAGNCNAGYLGPNCNCLCPEGTTGSSCENGQEVSASVCGETITSEGTYETPNYPSRSSVWEERSCVYVIQAAQADQIVEVEFEDFSFYRQSSIGGSAICYHDQVEIRLGGANSEAEFTCAELMKGQTVQSEGNELVILINSRTSSGRGMKFHVRFNNPTTTQPPTTTAPTTTQPPTTTAPTTTQPPTTTAPTTTSTATTSETTSTSTGTTSTSPSTTTTAPVTTTPSTTSTTTPSTTTEPADDAVTCSSTVSVQTLATGSSVEIKSTNYGTSDYPNNHACAVVVKTANSSDKLMFEILDFNVENHPWCRYDAMRVREANGPNVHLISCGSVSSYSSMLSGSTMMLEFVTDGSVTASGFKVRFTAVAA